MNERHEIKIEVNAANPVEYLACCGIFEIASRFDETSSAHWQTDGATGFVMETDLSEIELLKIILPTLTNLNLWEAVYKNGGRRKLSNSTKSKDDKLIRLEILFFRKENQAVKIALDWWYETIREDEKFSSSKWKMYAAQQNPEQLSEEFANEGVKNLRNSEISSLTGLLKAQIKSQSKFGFDPRPCTNALDLGFVPNDLSAKDKGFPTYLFAEMLSVFGAQFFFPARTGRPKDTNSTRSWQAIIRDNKRDERFIYCLWNEPVPISLARVLASNRRVSFHDSLTFKSVKDRRGDYLGNLKFSTLANPTDQMR